MVVQNGHARQAAAREATRRFRHVGDGTAASQHLDDEGAHVVAGRVA
jgi:hypothetical protein